MFAFGVRHDKLPGSYGFLGAGLSDAQIAADTGVKRGTVRNFRRGTHPPLTVERRQLAVTWSVKDAKSYCYLLGAYLGDGTVCVQRTIWLQIVNDRRYPSISREILEAMATTFPGPASRMHPSSQGESDVRCITIPQFSGRFLSTELGESTSGRSFLPTGSSNWLMPIPVRYFAD